MKNIYVGNLASSVSEEKLRELFEQFGEVTNVKMIKDKFTGMKRDFAFVDMPSDEEAQEAMNKLNGQTLDGKTLKVNEARPPEPRSSSSRPGGAGAGRFGGDRRGPRNNNGGGWGR